MPWETSDRREHLPNNWRQLREKRFELDGWQCTWKNVYDERCDEDAEECDHIGDRDDHRLVMLRSLCKFHHGKKSGAEGAIAANARRAVHNTKFRREEPHPGIL